MFSERAKTIALAIVKIFETSKPFGNYSAVAVLDDGAGISYGTSQFTHKSRSLWAVLQRFGKLGGRLPPVVLDAMPDFEDGLNIIARQNNKQIRNALAELGKHPLMQQAQREIAFENYLKPALDACEGSGFVLPLSLAVIYDSINHGSYAKIRDKVKLELPSSIKPEQYEREWITAYVRERHKWLLSLSRLKKTAYRTAFFLDQIKTHNWNLTLPMTVHGFVLSDNVLFPVSAAAPPKPKPEPAGHPVTSDLDTSQATAADLEKLVEPGAEFTELVFVPEPGGEFTEGERPKTDLEPGPETSGAAPGATDDDKAKSPQLVDKERPSTFTRAITWVCGGIGGIIASITATCGGSEIATMVANRGASRMVENADRGDLYTFGIVMAYIIAGLAVGLAFFYLGTKIYDRSAERANRLNQDKLKFAASQDHNTVEFKRPGGEK